MKKSLHITSFGEAGKKLFNFRDSMCLPLGCYPVAKDFVWKSLAGLAHACGQSS